MLWVDALRELDIPETAALSRRMSFRRVLSVFVAFLLPLAAAFLIVGNSMLPEIQERWAIEEPALGPVQISFNKPVASYKYRDEVKIDLVPKTSCYLYLFDITDEHDPVIMLHPIVGFSAFVRAGHERSITDFGPSRITVGEWPSKLHLVALISDDPLVQKSYQAKFLPQSNPLRIDGGALLERIDDFKRRSPDGVLHLVLNAPRADIGEEES